MLFSCLLANVWTVDAQMADSADSLTINEYVASVVQGYSYANNLMVDSISNAIPVIDAETLEVDHYLFFAFVENAVKGFVNVYGSSNIYMFRDSNEPDGIISINVSEEALTDATKVVYSDSHNVYPDWAGGIY